MSHHIFLGQRQSDYRIAAKRSWETIQRANDASETQSLAHERRALSSKKEDCAQRPCQSNRWVQDAGKASVCNSQTPPVTMAAWLAGVAFGFAATGIRKALQILCVAPPREVARYCIVDTVRTVETVCTVVYRLPRKQLRAVHRVQCSTASPCGRFLQDHACHRPPANPC